jgi:hypothetical protein
MTTKIFDSDGTMAVKLFVPSSGSCQSALWSTLMAEAELRDVDGGTITNIIPRAEGHRLSSVESEPIIQLS